MARITRNTRGVGFEYKTQMGNHHSSNSCDKLECEGGNGSKNLQRILKMKEKIRLRNNNLVKKMKEATIKSSK